MNKAVKNEIPLFVNGNKYGPGTLFTWEEDKKAYIHRNKDTGKVVALMFDDTVDNFPDEFKRADYE